MHTPPFHDGELEAQRRAGESERALSNGRAIADSIPAGALTFLEQQPFVLVAALDSAGQPWAWIAAGEAGFARAESARKLALDGARLRWLPAQLREQLARDPRAGLLFIEPATRRRLRVNGRARLTETGGFELEVQQAFPNCPKYIQRRALAPLAAGPASAAPVDSFTSGGARLEAELAARIARADTFFVASRGPDDRLDISHRGGPAGFVRVQSDGSLRIPDYPGNSMFNTFGNLLRDARAGLLFADFESGDVLQLVGRATVDFAAPEAGPAALASGRAWSFAPEAWRWSPGALPLRMFRLP